MYSEEQQKIHDSLPSSPHLNMLADKIAWMELQATNK